MMKFRITAKATIEMSAVFLFNGRFIGVFPFWREKVMVEELFWIRFISCGKPSLVLELWSWAKAIISVLP